MTKVLVLLSLIITIPAFATDPDPVAQKTVASKAYVDTKQDIIETDVLDYTDPEDGGQFQLGTLVSYDETSGLVGNKIGIYPYVAHGIDDLPSFIDIRSDVEAAYLDNYIPTVRAVANAFQNILDNMPSQWTALTWDSAETTSTNAYEIKFVGDTGATVNAWPRADKTKLINTAALAQGLALKQNKIPATAEDYYSVLTDTDDDGVIGKLRIITANDLQDGDLVLDNYYHAIPDTDAVQSELYSHWQPKIPEGTTPQNIYTNGSVLTYTDTPGEVGETYIIYPQTLSDMVGNRETTMGGSEYDNMLVSVEGLLNGLAHLYWNPLHWDWYSSSLPSAINTYSTTFDSTSTHVNGRWPYNTEGFLVTGKTFANSLALKQNKLDAKSTGDAAPKGNQAVVLNTAGNPSTVYTTAGKNLALTAKSGASAVINYVNGTTASATFATGQGLTEAQVKSALVSLELVKDVYSELNTKITNNALPTGTTGTVVTYNGTNATTGVQEFTETAVYDPTDTYDASTDAGKLATMASVKYVCVEWDGDTHTDEHCWIWALPN